MRESGLYKDEKRATCASQYESPTNIIYTFVK